MTTDEVPAETDEIPIRVRYAETDRMGLLHHANYFVYFEMGRTELLRKRGHSSVCSELASYHLKCLPAVSMSANKVVQLLPGMPSNGTQHSML